MSSVVRVLVVGYGAAGSSVIHGLTSPQYKNRIDVSILVRPESLKSTDAKKSAALASFKELGAKLIAGDINADETTLTSTLRGFHTIISTVSGEDLLVQIKLIHAAVAAGVKHFFPSDYGFDPQQIGRNSAVPLFDQKLDVQDAVIKSGIDYTFITNGAFTEFAISPMFGVNIAEGTLLAYGSADNVMTTTSLADIGQFVAAAVLSPAARNTTIHLAGDTLSFKQIAAAMELVTGKPVKLTVRTADELQAKIQANPGDFMSRFGLIVAQQIGVSSDKKTSWNAVNVPNHKPTDVTQYIRNVIAAKPASA